MAKTAEAERPTKVNLTSARLRDTRVGGALVASAGIVFLLLNTVAESTYPDYSVKTNLLSDLGAVGHSTTVFWDGQLFVSGVLLALGLYLLLVWGAGAQLVRSKPVKVVYLLAPAGVIVASLFPENMVGAVHALGAFVTFIFGGISAVYAFRFTMPPMRYLSLLLGLITLLSIPLFVAGGSYLGSGGSERLVVYPFTIWQIAFGAYWMGFSK